MSDIKLTELLKIFNKNAINVTSRNLLGTMVYICFNVFGTVITLSSLNSSDISIRRESLLQLISTKLLKAK